MIRDEDGALTGYVYLDLKTKDYGGLFFGHSLIACRMHGAQSGAGQGSSCQGYLLLCYSDLGVLPRRVSQLSVSRWVHPFLVPSPNTRPCESHLLFRSGVLYQNYSSFLSPKSFSWVAVGIFIVHKICYKKLVHRIYPLSRPAIRRGFSPLAIPTSPSTSISRINTWREIRVFNLFAIGRNARLANPTP